MNDILKELFVNYNADYRHYHNLSHLANMFEVARKCNIKLTECENYAIWFHDIVYIPGAKDNEIKSAEVAVEWLISNTRLCNTEVQVVKQIILDTQNEIDTCGFSSTVIDLDICDLCNADKFKANSKKIKKEYLAYDKKIISEDFEKGRKNWAKSFLKRKSIYVGFMNTHENEKAARVNLMIDTGD